MKSLTHLLLVLIMIVAATTSVANGSLDGETAFLACAGCHSIAAGAPPGVGPNLHGIEGRRAGTAEGFSYSPALQQSELVWGRGTLTGWIHGAELVVPGTWMLYHNHLTADEVEKLVNYILEASNSEN